MSTARDKLERRFNAWWAAEGFKQAVDREGDYEQIMLDVKCGWMGKANTKEQG